LDLITNRAHRSLRHDQCFGYNEAVSVWGYDTFLAHIQPVDRDRVDACYQKAMAGLGTYDAEFRTTWPDGSAHWLWTNGRFYFDDKGSPCRVAGIVSDITERKLAAEALQETQAMLARTEEIGKIGGWEFDIDTMQQTWTKAVYAIHEVDFTGYPTVEQGISFYTPESRPIIEQAVKRAIEHGEPFDLDLEIITAKGNLRAVHTIGRHDPARGKIVGFFQDITERKHAALLLAESESQRLAEISAALEVQAQSSRTALILMEDAVAARQHAESLGVTLTEQLDELRRRQQATLNRESRILSVKKEINDLLAAHGQPPRYPSALNEGAEK
jgi:PAS domain S-box-containing protein